MFTNNYREFIQKKLKEGYLKIKMKKKLLLNYIIFLIVAFLPRCYILAQTSLGIEYGVTTAYGPGQPTTMETVVVLLKVLGIFILISLIFYFVGKYTFLLIKKFILFLKKIIKK